jgi:hypothetical protein
MFPLLSVTVSAKTFRYFASDIKGLRFYTVLQARNRPFALPPSLPPSLSFPSPCLPILSLYASRPSSRPCVRPLSCRYACLRRLLRSGCCRGQGRVALREKRRGGGRLGRLGEVGELD